jgi:RNA polymerase sigma-70 factor (ECF subfamily)
MDNSDQSDLASALTGDGDAYARIIRRHQQAIARRMLSFTRDKSMVEELTQDVFVQAYLGLTHYRADAPMGHWLQRIATRVGYAFWKRRATRKMLPLAAAGQVAGPQEEPGGEILRMLEQLPPRDRLVLQLLHVEGLNVAEAADLSGWSRTMVKVQAFRARKKFKLLIEKAGLSPQGATR